MAAFDGFGIPGNEEVFGELVALLRTSEAIGFVGAGASAPLYPLWTQLIEQLADRAVATRSADETTKAFWYKQATKQPDQIAQQVRDALDPGEYAALMRRLFKPCTLPGSKDRFTPAHAILIQLPFQGFITTNYDPGLEEACRELRPDRKPMPFTWSDDQVTLWLREPLDDPKALPILQAHGRFDRKDSLVLCIEDYRRLYYAKAHAYLDLLGHLFTRERLIFVGFGFNDPWVRSFADRVQTLAGLRQLTEPRHLAILGIPEEDKHDARLHDSMLRESLRARVLFYPTRNGSHAALGELLDTLLAALEENDARETGPGPEPTKPPHRPPALAHAKPHFRDQHSERVATELSNAYKQRDTLLEAQAETTALDTRILNLKRSLRHGPQLHPGEFLGDGRYQLIKPLGQGGFATVWLAIERTKRRQVAVKVLHGQFSTSEERRERLFRGARQMAKLDHPHIVRVLDEPSEDEGWAFFVMEYLAGGDFRRAVLDGKLDHEKRWAVLERIAEAIDHAHEKGIVHRDIKPGNILLDTHGLPKLADFDLVRADDTTGLTRTRAGMGSYVYAAPESMEDAAGATRACDIYSMAATLVFAWHGKPLSSHFLLDRSSYLASQGLPDVAVEVLKKGLHVDPNERPESASALCRAFRETLRLKSESSKPEPPKDSPSARREGQSPSISQQFPPRIPAPEPPSRHSRDSEELFRTITTHGGEVPLWCEIPAGQGWIGSPEDEEGRDPDEGPRHRIGVVAPFWMGAVPVTNAQYAAFDATKARGDRPHHPVVNVSWHDAMKFCRWLADEQGFEGARLPTEEEWEYACRAKTTSRYWSGDTESDLERVGWYRANSEGKTHPVAQKPDNPWGLYDVHGNVWEWTLSPWTNDYSKQAKVQGRSVDPAALPADLAAPSPRGSRVVRGGSFWVDPRGVRSACRVHGDPGGVSRNLGFRVLLPFAPSDD